MKFKAAIIIASVSFLAIVPYPVNAKSDVSATVDYGPLKEAVSQLIKKEMRKNDVVGMSIALVDDQRVVWAQGFGYADEKNDIAAEPDTVYRAGTLTMLFTATAAMQLVEQGTLDIDRPLKTHLPDFTIRSRFNNSRPITLRDLLTHHAGLPSNLQKGMWSSKPELFTGVAGLLKDEYAAYPPGFLYSFSSVGMTLAGHAVERAAGRDYASVVTESILQPLSMGRSDFARTAPGKGVSKSYRKGREAEAPLLRDLPSEGLRSTVLDMSCFMQMLFNNGKSGNRRILKPETIAEMFRPQNADVPLDLGLRTGLGWALSGLGEIDIQNAGVVAHHGGLTPLFNSQMIVLPQHKLGVVVMANSASSGRAVNRAAAKAIELALEAKAGIKQPEHRAPGEVEVELAPRLRQIFEGTYASLAGIATIKAKSGHFHAEVMGHTFQLPPHAEDRFGIKYRLLGLFEINIGDLDHYELSRATIAGREVLKASMKGRELLVAEKLQPAAVPEAWSKRAGEYTITNLGNDLPLIEDIVLRVENNLLVIECAAPFFFKGTVRLALQPVSPTEAVIAGLGRGMGETIRVVQMNGREALRYSGYVLTLKEQ